MTYCKKAARPVALLLALVLLCSVLFVIAEADHDCHGEDCAICAQIVRCVSLLRELLPALLLAAAFAALCRRLPHRTAPAGWLRRLTSPIALKVKLSN